MNVGGGVVYLCACSLSLLGLNFGISALIGSSVPKVLAKATCYTCWKTIKWAEKWGW